MLFVKSAFVCLQRRDEILMRATGSVVYTRLIIAVLSLIVFPLLVFMAFYSTQKLIASLTKFQFTLPSQPPSSLSENTIRPPEFKGSLPTFLNFSFPNIPFLTYSNVLILIAVIVISLVSIQAFRLLNHRLVKTKPLSDIDVLVEEREKVAEILDDAVRRLSLGSNYRDTVLKCYKQVVETLVARSPFDSKALTAKEFREIVSQKLKFDSDYLSRVTSLFEVARYSMNEITKENANEAIMCLTSLSKELRTLDSVSTPSDLNSNI